MSASLNTLAGTLYEDFFAKCISKKSNTTKANFIMKITVVILGCICVIMVYLVEHLKGILQVHWFHFRFVILVGLMITFTDGHKSARNHCRTSIRCICNGRILSVGKYQGFLNSPIHYLHSNHISFHLYFNYTGCHLGYDSQRHHNANDRHQFANSHRHK